MDEILNSFSSPAWWFSAVFLAVLVNVVSAYLKSPIDKLFSKVFATWRSRNDLARARYASRLKQIGASSDLQMLCLLEALALRSKSNSWLVVVVINGLFLSASLQVRIAELLSPVAIAKVAERAINTNHVLVVFLLVAIVGAMRTAYAASDLEELVSQARRQAPQSGA